MNCQARSPAGYFSLAPEARIEWTPSIQVLVQDVRFLRLLSSFFVHDQGCLQHFLLSIWQWTRGHVSSKTVAPAVRYGLFNGHLSHGTPTRLSIARTRLGGALTAFVGALTAFVGALTRLGGALTRLGGALTRLV